MGELEEIAERLENVVMGYEAKQPEGKKDGRFSYPFDRGVDRANQLKERLLKKYEGCDIASETGLETLKTEYGELLYGEKAVEKKLQKPETSEKDILSDLKLIYGIGEVRERKLKERGYETVDDLLQHPRWGDRVSSLRERIGNQNPGRIYRVLSQWKRLSDPSFLTLSGMFRPRDFAFVDIETMGLSNQPIFLLGLAHPDGDLVRVHQFLARDPRQEVAALTAFTKHMDGRGLVLTYNGHRFDVPYIERRLEYYGINWEFTQPHLDLYRFAKDSLCRRTVNCKLGTVETSILGIERDLDVPSSQVPDFYRTFIEEENPGPLLPILSHHRQDMLSLVDLYKVLTEVKLDAN
ncbi:ribonuclease H-like domain-containing protein [Candidatus Bipolaricaulota bacterium]|nr:ribonuclease H-like domain-containing protein [Candidatus Bipolaricaulota bacterium]